MATLPRRLAAMCYDSILLLAIAWGVSAAVLAIRIAILGSVTVGQARGGDPVLMLILLGAWALFFIWFWSHGGQTLGMQAWRLRVETLDGESPDWSRALRRLAAASVSLACLGAGYWWMLFDAHQRTWHDRWSATRIVVLPKN